ncbi:MAG: hypothetical protein FE834_02090 [Gammaproteobacteria bacterium]|nr:hypothetical protein [Gammaproteobacteria bacterium]
MLSLRKYVEEVIAYIPQVDADRCVHSKLEVSNCSRCVDICPHSAWNLDDESLSINITACVGCGLCVPVCPEAAIEYEYQHKAKNYKEQKVNIFACQYSEPIEPKDSNIFCINIISIFELLHLYAGGTKALFFSTGDCDNCTYHCADGLVSKVEKINHLLTSRQRPNLKLLRIKTKKSKIQLATLPDFDQQSNRRLFLRNMLASSVELVTDQEDEQKPIAMTELLPTNEQGETQQYLYPFVPQLDEFKCNLCNACIRLCPHQSFQLGEQTLTILADTCTGCNICIDVCEQEAIEIKLWHKSEQDTIKITTHSCKSCGVGFSIPAASNLSATQCSICTIVNHNRNLHQIVDP